MQKTIVTALIFALLGGVIAMVVSMAAPKQYESRSSLMFSVRDMTDVADLSDVSSYLYAQLPTYAALVEEPVVMSRAVAASGTGTNISDLSERTEVSIPENTFVIDVQVRNADPESASREANALTEGLSATIADVAPRTPQGEDVVKSVRIAVAQAQDPTRPALPLAVFIGAVLGGLAGILFTRLKSTLSEHDEPSDSSVEDISNENDHLEDGGYQDEGVRAKGNQLENERGGW